MKVDRNTFRVGSESGVRYRERSFAGLRTAHRGKYSPESGVVSALRSGSKARWTKRGSFEARGAFVARRKRETVKWRGTRVPVVRRDIQGPQIFVRRNERVYSASAQPPRKRYRRLPVVCNSTRRLNRFYPYPYITLNPPLYAPPVDITLGETPPMRDGYKNFSSLFRVEPGTFGFRRETGNRARDFAIRRVREIRQILVRERGLITIFTARF